MIVVLFYTQLTAIHSPDILLALVQSILLPRFNSRAIFWTTPKIIPRMESTKSTLFAIRGIFHYKRSKGWLQGQRTISTRSSINSRIIDGSTRNYDRLNHIFRGFLDSARWLPKPIATAREPLIYQHILGLFAPPWTVFPTVLLRDLNFKLGDRPPPDKIALAEGGTVLFETRSIDTVGGTTAFDLSRPGTRDRFGAKAWKGEHLMRSLPRQVLFCRAEGGR